MTTTVTLMAVPTVGVTHNPPRFLLQEQASEPDGIRTEGVWRDLGYSVEVSEDLIEIQSALEVRFREQMDLIDQEQEHALDVMYELQNAWYYELYAPLIPKKVHKILDQAVREATIKNEVPTLRIHVAPELDWIPWEIMYDGEDFLGLRFQIARLPIVDQVPDLSNDQPHPVESIVNVLGDLGQGVLDIKKDPNGPTLWETWTHTFSDLIAGADSNHIAERRIPPDRHQGPWPMPRNLADAVDSDILHFTCHGGFKSVPTKGAYWALNYAKAQLSTYQISIDKVAALDLSLRRPLVFGNACSSAAGGAAPLPGRGLIAGFGPAFFASGAMAFVGTFAPIRARLALEFSRQFYRRLLGDGLPIAEALQATKEFYRRETLDQKDNDLSWLFYCLYGPPDTRFVFGP